jgi:hypothetical protein
MTEQRKELLRLVNRYAAMTKQSQRDVWATIYNLLGRNQGITLRTYQKRKRETLLDVAERVGVLPLLNQTISQMIASASVVGARAKY